MRRIIVRGRDGRPHVGRVRAPELVVSGGCDWHAACHLATHMHTLGWIAAPWIATLVFWSVFAACVIEPSPDPGALDPPAARLVTTWDPLACGTPHRVAIELEHEDGLGIAASAPCPIGGVTLDAPRFGVYRGRAYAWTLGEPVRSVQPIAITLDAPIVRLQLPTPR